jgi:SH3 domain-containing YSC84-like protein 1
MRILKLAAAACIAATCTLSAAQASDQTELLAHATRVARHMDSDPSFSQARDMLHRARAVLIIPALVKGGFIFGAEGGNGVLVRHNGRHWGSPAFYSMGSASFGLQAGLEQAEIVMLVMSDRALRGIEQDEFKLGAGGGITVVTLSGGAEGATSGHGGDIVVWTSATGAYGGLTFNGSVIKPRHEWNADFYGHKTNVSAILSSSEKNPASHELQAELDSIR